MTKLAELLGSRTGHAALRVDEALTALLARMTDELVAAKNHLGLAKTEQRRLAGQAEVAAHTAAEWGQRAMSAARAGDDVTAREALMQKLEHERTTAGLREASEKLRGEVARRKSVLSEQGLRVEDAKRKKNDVVLRAKGAGAETWLLEKLRASAGISPTDLLEQLDASLANVEREAALAHELSDEALAAGAAAPALRPKMPLAKTDAGKGDPESRRARAATARERRTRR